MGSLVQAHPEAPGRKTPACLPFFLSPPRRATAMPPPLPLTRHPPRRATAMPPPPPLFPHIVGSRHGATEPPMRTAPSRRAERAACRRYAIMVSPTQSVPEVLAVWGSDYKIAIVCRRYTIMVAQNPTTNPHTSQTPSQIPTTHHHHPRPYHNRVPPARCSFHSPPHRPSTPSNDPQKK